MNRPDSTFYGTIKNGKIVFDHPGIVKEWVSKLHEDIRIEVNIRQEHHEPSRAMRGYYWIICKITSKETGYTKEEIDVILCEHFLTRNRGTKNQYVESKANLSDQEFSDLIDFTIQFVAREWGIVVPPPNKDWKGKI